MRAFVVSKSGPKSHFPKNLAREVTLENLVETSPGRSAASKIASQHTEGANMAKLPGGGAHELLHL